MMKYCGILKENCPFKGIISFSNPFDVWLAINLMHNSFFEPYLAASVKETFLLKKGCKFQ